MAKKSADKNKSCPFCDETIKISAIKCKHCQSALIALSDKTEIHIHNTISNKSSDKAKPKSYFVNPVPYVNDRKIGHGIASIGLSLAMFFGGISALEDETLVDDDLLATILTMEIMLMFVACYALWIIFQEQSSKVWPIISLVLSGLFMVSFLGYWP